MTKQHDRATVGHVTGCFSCQEESTLRIHGEDAIVVFLGQLVDRPHRADAGVDEQDIDTAMLAHDFRDQGTYRVEVGRVEGYDVDPFQAALRQLKHFGVRPRRNHGCSFGPEGPRGPEVARLHTNLHTGNMRPFFQIVDAAKRGDIAVDLDAARLVLVIVGPLFYRRWFSKEAIDDAFVAFVARQALLPSS